MLRFTRRLKPAGAPRVNSCTRLTWHTLIRISRFAPRSYPGPAPPKNLIAINRRAGEKGKFERSIDAEERERVMSTEAGTRTMAETTRGRHARPPGRPGAEIRIEHDGSHCASSRRGTREDDERLEAELERVAGRGDK